MALGDPTRHSIFRYVAAKRRPVDVAELTAHVGLHHNAVRQHLARLVDAGLVEEPRPRRRVGDVHGWSTRSHRTSTADGGSSAPTSN